MRRSPPLRHGPMTMALGRGRVRVGSDLLPLLPSNHLYYDPPKLRARLDQDGYLFFKNVVPRPTVQRAFVDVANQLLANGWIRPEDREAAAERLGPDAAALAVPYPSAVLRARAAGVTGPAAALPPPTAGFDVTPDIAAAIAGVNVMTVVRQVLSGGVVCLPGSQSLELAEPGEASGFHCDSLFTSRGTKLLLTAWMPLHDVPLSLGGLAVVRGSNSTASYRHVRSTYGSYDIEAGDVRGDASLTDDPKEILALSDWAVSHRDDTDTERRRARVAAEAEARAAVKAAAGATKRMSGGAFAAAAEAEAAAANAKNAGGTVDELLRQQRRVGGQQYDGYERYASDDEDEEALAFGNPLLSSSFEAGDLVLTTVYTMHSFLTNQTHGWRVSAETKWMMEGDDAGADPRFRGDRAVGMSRWHQKRDDPTIYPRTMAEARAAWGLTDLTALARTSGEDAA